MIIPARGGGVNIRGRSSQGDHSILTAAALRLYDNTEIRSLRRRPAGGDPISSIASTNTALNVICIFISVTILFCLLIAEDRRQRLNRLFIWMLAFNIGVLLCDLFTWVFEGRGGDTMRTALTVINGGVYSFGYVILGLYTGYLAAFIGQKARVPRAIVPTIGGLCAVAIALVIVSQFNQMYFYFDDANIYRRGGWYWLSQTWAIALMLVNAAIVAIHRRKLARREVLALLSYGALPVVAMAIQIFVYGLTLLYVSTTLSMFVIYVNIQVEQAGRLRAQEKELTESRVAIMLSQIQPHFLFNALVTIRQLCDLDQAQAKEAIGEFAGYLRTNLDSLTHKEPVPFAEELAHAMTYIALETRRFEGRLRVEYDIRAQDFCLPALTLQPIVENAIRHGVTKRPDGGKLTIRTGERDTDWRIEVLDDGVGFDVNAPAAGDGRSHIGLGNVRQRLEAMCRGSLVVCSAPGAGTSVTISIPKEDGLG